MYLEEGIPQGNEPMVDKQLFIFLQGLKDEVRNLTAVSNKLNEKAKVLIGNSKTDKISEPLRNPSEATLINELFETLESIRFVRREIEDTDVTFNSVF